MSEENIPVVVIGLGDFGYQTAAALKKCVGADLVAVCDCDQHKCEQIANELGVEPYTDPRQLILKTKPRACFIATPPMVAPELLGICLKNGVNVWKEAPLGRDLGEAVEMVHQFNDAGLKLAVGTHRRFSETYMQAKKLLPKIGEVFLARVHYLFNWGGDLKWRCDKLSAGGGALLELGYHITDLLIWMLGLPEEVYALITCESEKPNGGDAAYPPHDTDDSTVATLRYRNNVIASLVASRVSGPVSEQLVIHGTGGSITVNPDACTLRGPDGEIIERMENTLTLGELFCRQVQGFVDAIRNDEETCIAAGEENLLTHAAIGAMYLSGHTAQPESPRSQLEIHRVFPSGA
ncbi:MAG: Gfo/Idh/MocA family oxidoreductase [Phycisphaerae bacterium]|nr:Gfo/Idh/MocA family oxidoreductase [Phycisphaerae bacterium]